MEITVNGLSGTGHTLHLVQGATVADLVLGLAKSMKKDPSILAIIRNDGDGRILRFAEEISSEAHYQYLVVDAKTPEDRLASKVRMFFHAVAEAKKEKQAAEAVRFPQFLNSRTVIETEERLRSGLRVEMDAKGVEMEMDCDVQSSTFKSLFPWKFAFTRTPGEVLTSQRFRLEGVPGDLSIDYYPKGTRSADAGNCSVFLTSHSPVAMRCTIGVGPTKRVLDHVWAAGESWGYSNFCKWCYHDDLQIDVNVERIFLDDLFVTHEKDQTKGQLSGDVSRIMHIWETELVVAMPCPRGKSLRSQPFKLPGCDDTFRIEYFPAGQEGAKEGHCSAYMLSISDTACKTLIKLEVNGRAKRVSCGYAGRAGTTYGEGVHVAREPHSRKMILTAELPMDFKPQHIVPEPKSEDVFRASSATSAVSKKSVEFKKVLERRTGKRSS